MPYTMLSTGLGSFTGAETTTFFAPCGAGHAERPAGEPPAMRNGREEHSPRPPPAAAAPRQQLLPPYPFPLPHGTHIVKVRLQRCPRQELAGALEHQLHAQRLPVQLHSQQQEWGAEVGSSRATSNPARRRRPLLRIRGRFF